MSIAYVEPMGIAGQMRRIRFALGPPAANVPAQLMKIAQGGRFKGGRAIITVVAASRDATISTGSRRELIVVFSFRQAADFMDFKSA
jgi:hypothetical protein